MIFLADLMEPRLVLRTFWYLCRLLQKICVSHGKENVFDLFLLPLLFFFLVLEATRVTFRAFFL